MPQPHTKARLTEAEYLRVDRTAACKSQFLDGEMFAMAGGTIEHGLIATNLARELGNRLKGRPCIPFNSDVRIKVEATGLYTYPDLSVICGPIQRAEDADDTATNPTVLVEVLSESTEAYDRGGKFAHYRQIPSLREYLLVSQKEARIEKFTLESEGRWTFNEAAGLGAILPLASLKTEISLGEVFANVHFRPQESSPPSVPR